MEHKIVLDTNVLVSALITKNEDSATYEILNLLLLKKIKLLFHMDIIKEYVDILYADRFNIDKNSLDNLIIFIIKNGIEKSINVSKIKMIDEEDRKFYDLWCAEKGAYLVTCNIKHFPKNKLILTPREFIDSIKGR